MRSANQFSLNEDYDAWFEGGGDDNQADQLLQMEDQEFREEMFDQQLSYKQ